MQGVYALDTLMEQTRQLAAEYYRTTQQTLPVSHELAKYDAARLLGLELTQDPQAGFDATSNDQRRMVVKSRVLLRQDLRGLRIGQVNPAPTWDALLLVTLAADYHPQQIFSLTYDQYCTAIAQPSRATVTKRRPLSIAKFIAIGEEIWARDWMIE